MIADTIASPFAPLDTPGSKIITVDHAADVYSSTSLDPYQ